nr:hypothetical protein [Tanacetum cinerariifolium]
ILDTYRETVTLKRRQDDDADKDEEPFAGPDRGSKIRKEGKVPKSVSSHTETATRSAGKSTQGSESRQASASESAFVKEPVQTTFSAIPGIVQRYMDHRMNEAVKVAVQIQSDRLRDEAQR